MVLVKKQKSEPVPVEERAQARDYQGLVAQLGDPRPSARRWAARDLQEFREAGLPLVQRLKLEPEGSVREVILTSLTRLADPAVITGLIDCLRSEDAALRNEVVDAMRQLPDEVAPVMRGLLGDADPDLRIFAVNILDSLRHPRVEQWLIEVIEGDPHLNVCATALDLLVEVGGEAAVEPLCRLKGRFGSEPYIQFAADLALKRIREN